MTRRNEDTRVAIIVSGEKKAFLYGLIDVIPGFPLPFGPTYASSDLHLRESIVSELKLRRLQ